MSPHLEQRRVRHQSRLQSDDGSENARNTFDPCVMALPSTLKSQAWTFRAPA
jgi:hypothetical protein